MIWGKKHVKCQKTSTGPICRDYIAILKSSPRDTFYPKIWVKKRVKCQKTSTGPTCSYYIANLISLLRDTFYDKIWVNFAESVKKHQQVLYVVTT